MDKYTKNMIWLNLSQIIITTTIFILTIIVLVQCTSTQNVHTNDLHKYNKKSLYNDCYIFANK